MPGPLLAERPNQPVIKLQPVVVIRNRDALVATVSAYVVDVVEQSGDAIGGKAHQIQVFSIASTSTHFGNHDHTGEDLSRHSFYLFQQLSMQAGDRSDHGRDAAGLL